MIYVGSSNVGPLKWMAPEALTKRTFSQLSDVWSFGITAIEILTRKPPYPDIPIAQFLREWKVLVHKPSSYIPADTPYFLKSILRRCFSMDPQSRPKFSVICDELEANQLLQSNNDRDSSLL